MLVQETYYSMWPIKIYVFEVAEFIYALKIKIYRSFEKLYMVLMLLVTQTHEVGFE